MKAILYADYMSIRQNLRAWLILFGFFFVLSIMNGEESILLAAIAMMGMFIPTTLFGFDSMGWDKLRMTMPISRRNIVSGKFVFLMLSNIAVMLICSIMIFIIQMKEGNLEFAETFLSIALCGAIAMIISGILMTAIIKWGVEKGRYFIVACIWIPIICVMLIRKFGGSLDVTMIASTINAISPYIVLAGAALIAICSYLCCYAISVRIYSKTEF